MWDKVSEDEGFDRLEELCETGAWKEIISMGASTAMISSISTNAKAEAEKIVSILINNARPVELAIQDEMINQGKMAGTTGAGQILDAQIREAQAEAEREIKRLHDALRKEGEETAARMVEAMRATELEVEKLKQQTEEQAREQQAHTERFRQERMEEDRKVEEWSKAMREQTAATEARMAEELREREREVEELRRHAEQLQRLAKEQAGADQDQAARIEEERQRLERVELERKELERRREEERAENTRQELERTERLRQELEQAQHRLNAIHARRRKKGCVIQ